MREIVEKARVFTAHDVYVGKVDRIVIDPLTHMVTHIVVRKGILFPEDKVIPTDEIATATEERINLGRDVDPDVLPAFIEHHYVPLDEFEQAQEAADGSTTLPSVWYGPLGIMTPVYESTMRAVTERNVPDRTVALEPGVPVYATGQHDIGRFEEVIMTDMGMATHIVISQDGFNPVRRAVPINWIETISETKVVLGTTEHMVRSIRPFDPTELPTAE